ncbi:MAG: aminotransferase class IV [bacterium]
MINVLATMESDERHKQTPADPRFSYGVAYIMDKYLPIEEAAVPITDAGFLRADACYDVVSVSRGMFFRLEDHLDRFMRGVPKIYLGFPYDRDRMREILVECVRLAGLKDSYVWWAITRGDTPHEACDRLKPEKYQNRFYAFAIPYVSLIDDEQRTRGFDLIISDSRVRIPPNAVDPTVKNFHWLDLTMSLFEAGQRGAFWSVLLGVEGYVTECPGSNLFLVEGGRVLTPSFGCLEGITRLTIMDLCRMEGIPVQEANITAAQLRGADEIFMTSTAGGIMPAGTIDGKAIGGRSGTGPITARLHDLYWTKRWEGWHATKVKYVK